MPKGRIKTKRRPKKFNVTQVAKTIKPLIEPVLDEGISVRDRIVASWSGDNKPSFVKFFEVNNSVISFGIEVQSKKAEGVDISVWRLLNDGTKVSRVIYSRDWSPKTGVNFNSNPGSGRVVYIDKTLNLPGIDGRFWDERANEKTKIDIERILNNAIRPS